MNQTEFWAMHWFGTYQVCERRKTFAKALAAAEACEADGGSRHDIWACTKMPRPRRKTRKAKVAASRSRR